MKLRFLTCFILFISLMSCLDEKKMNEKFEEQKILLEKNNELISGFISRYQNKEEFLAAIKDTPNFIDDNEIEVLMPIDCDTDRLQSFHIDLVNQFAILGKLKLDEEKKAIVNMKMIIKEIDGKSRYDLLKSKYKESKPDKDGIMTHHFELNIERGELSNSMIDVELGELKAMKKGEKIDFHVISKDPNIDSETINKNPKAFWTKFGNSFCRGIITNP